MNSSDKRLSANDQVVHSWSAETNEIFLERTVYGRGCRRLSLFTDRYAFRQCDMHSVLSCHEFAINDSPWLFRCKSAEGIKTVLTIRLPSRASTSQISIEPVSFKCGGCFFSQQKYREILDWQHTQMSPKPAAVRPI